MRIVCLFLLVVGCGSYEEGSDVEFITVEQVGRRIETGYLITKVHKDSWRIGYSFGSAKEEDRDEKCIEKMSPLETAVREEITSMLNIWLSALRDSDHVKRKIVDRLILLKINRETDRDFNNLDLYIRFFCSKNGKNGNIRGLAYTSNNRAVIDMFWLDKWDDRNPQKNSVFPRHVGKSEFNYFVLLHEMGHSFGLLDTYPTGFPQGGVVRRKESKGEVEHSDGMFPSTIGNNPPSLMSGAEPHNSLERDPPCRTGEYEYQHYVHTIWDDAGSTSPCLRHRRIKGIMPDDQKGLERLYLSYHTNKIKNNRDCFHPDYELEVYGTGEGKACVPKNPIMFMLKNGYDLYRSEVTKRWGYPDCSVNELYGGVSSSCSFRTIPDKYLQPEQIGLKRSPIHYAVMLRGGTPSGPTFIEFYHNEINVKDALGMTPLHYSVGPYGGSFYTTSLLVDKVVHLCATPIHSRSDFCVKMDKADVNSKNNNGMTPLHLVAQLGHVHDAEILLKSKDIDLSIKDKWGLTPLQRAKYRKRFWETKSKILTLKEIERLQERHETRKQRDAEFQRHYDKHKHLYDAGESSKIPYLQRKDYANAMIDNIKQVINLIERTEELQAEWPCWGQYGCDYSDQGNLCRRCLLPYNTIKKEHRDIYDVRRLDRCLQGCPNRYFDETDWSYNVWPWQK